MLHRRAYNCTLLHRFGPLPNDHTDPANEEPANGEPQRVRVPFPMSPVWATWVLLGTNVVLYVLTYLLSMGLTSEQFCFQFASFYDCALFLLGWKDNAQIYLGSEYWRLFTAMFLHGNLIHIAFNGFALYALGPEAERVYGTSRFLGVYLLAGLAGSVASYALTPAPSVGASGAIFGLVGALAMFYFTARRLLGEAGRMQLQSMGFIVLVNLGIGFSIGGVIDNFAHIGGLLGGAAAGWLLVPRYQVEVSPLAFGPQITRRGLPGGWVGAGLLLLLLAGLALLITPPL